MRTMGDIWLSRHGAPCRVSADEEFDVTEKNQLGIFLSSLYIKIRLRQVLLHNKVLIAKRKHGTIKRILERLQLEKTEAGDSVVLSRATFLSNFFAGTHLLSVFELDRGFCPSMLGIPVTVL